MPALRALVRPAAALTAALLVAGVAQTAPAAADDSASAPLTLTVSAPAGVTGSGATTDQPALLGSSPASTTLTIRLVNTGLEPLLEPSVVTATVANGTVSAPTCEPTAVLEPGSSLSCDASVAGVVAGTTHEDVTTATARTPGGEVVTVATGFYATSVDDSVTVGDRVWLDRDRDGVQGTGEPGIGGVRLDVTGPEGVPARDVAGRAVGPQVTTSDGAYAFTRLTRLPAGSAYTVTVDPTSTPLTGREPTRAGVGDAATDSSTGSATSSDSLPASGSDRSLDFGFVDPPAPAPAKAAVALTVKASPDRAVTGSTITVKGSLKRSGKAYKASTVLEFSADDSGRWSKVKTVKSSRKGALSATTKAARSGSFRYRYAGNATTAAGTSGSDHVDVRKATVRLTVNAPGSVTKGKSIKVKGSIRREGKKFRATTVLEFRRDGDDGWSKVKKVRSSKKGALSTSVKPSASGSYRYRYAGSSTTEAGASGGDRVVVKPKPPAKPKPRAYKNCTALQTVYPHGVGRSGAKDKTRSGSNPVTDFVRDTKTYNLNTKSDRDDDGIACEAH